MIRNYIHLPTAVVVLSITALSVDAQEKSKPLDKAPSKFAKLDKIRVHYKSIGEGKKALVFIHGWTCNLNHWRGQIPAFKGKIRMVFVDLPGHGMSDKPKKIKYSMDLFARAVDTVLKDAGVEKAVLAGHSMGTPVVRQYYRLYPKKTLGLVAVDGALRNVFPQDRATFFVKLFEGPNYKEFAGKMVAGMFKKASEKQREEVKNGMLNTPQHVMLGALKGMLDPAIWKDDKIEVPVVCIMAKSPTWSEDYKKNVKKLAPQLEYREMKGVGHFVMLEDPATFNEILHAFMNENKFLRNSGDK